MQSLVATWYVGHMDTGDILKWTYLDKQRWEPVPEEEWLWSTLENRYVPIGSGLVHFLVYIDSVKISWMNALGYFEAYRDNFYAGKKAGRPVEVSSRLARDVLYLNRR